MTEMFTYGPCSMPLSIFLEKMGELHKLDPQLFAEWRMHFNKFERREFWTEKERYPESERHGCRVVPMDEAGPLETIIQLYKLDTVLFEGWRTHSIERCLLSFPAAERVKLLAVIQELEKELSKYGQNGIARYNAVVGHFFGVVGYDLSPRQTEAVGKLNRLLPALFGRPTELAPELIEPPVYEGNVVAFTGKFRKHE